MIGSLLDDLRRQTGVGMSLHVVECGDDGSIGALELPAGAEVVDPAENLGYSGGNNRVLQQLADQSDPVAIINPDVHLTSDTFLSELIDVLKGHPDMAAIAPTIRTPDGLTEYTGSQIDLRRGLAIHVGTHVAGWPPGTPDVVDMPWIDGACLIIRPRALKEVGFFDEHFFLYSEEVDWCLRARRSGWRLGVASGLSVSHRRSSSFQGTTKGAYYAHRNSFYLFRKHYGWGPWVAYWCWRLLRFISSGTNRRNGESRAAVYGAWHALLGRGGRMPGDR